MTSDKMYRYLVLAVTIVGISCALQTRKRSAAECSNQSVYEDCIQTLFMIDSPDQHFPDSTERVANFCGKLNETDKCVKDYTQNCMSPVGRRATEVTIAGIARLAKRMCKSPERMQEFVKNSQCGIATIGDMKTCLNDYKVSLDVANLSSTQKLPILCCKFHDFRGCVRQGFQRVGPELCPEESRMFFARIADAFQSDALDLICSDYDEGSDNCSKLVVPVVEAVANTRSLFGRLKDLVKSIFERS